MSRYNIDVAGTHIAVVDDGGAERVIASDSKDMMLVVTLNVSGAHGLPSSDHISYSHGDQPCLFPPESTTEGRLRKLRLGFKYPPGELLCAYIYACACMHVCRYVGCVLA